MKIRIEIRCEVNTTEIIENEEKTSRIITKKSVSNKSELLTQV